MLDSLEEPEPEPGTELPELDDPFAASSRWHCSSAAPVSPVQSGLVVPVDDGDALLDGDGDVVLDDGEALLPPDVLPEVELSVPDDPELMLGLLLDELELGLLVELLLESDALLPVPLELLP